MRTIAVYHVVPSDGLRARRVVMVDLEVTSLSCHLNVTSATHELSAMPGDRAETPESERPIRAGASAYPVREKLDRRVSVAAMMDWTDWFHRANETMNLNAAEWA